MVTSNTVSIIIYYRCHSVQVLLNWHFIVSKMSTISIFLLYVSCLCYLVGLAVSAHFRGGIIQWRPVNARAFDGEVSF